MKIIDPAGRVFQRGFVGDVPTGKLVWVDLVNGNDVMALRESATAPFRTLTAAKVAAFPGDTIVVLPGVYTEKNLLRHLVNWHFMNGARVEGTGGAIFDTGASGTNGAVTCRITGHGDFYSDDSAILASTVGASDIYLEALKMYSGGDSCVYISAASKVFVRVKAGIVCSAGSSQATVRIAGIECHVEADSITAASAPCVDVVAGALYLAARSIYASSDNAVEITGGAATITADEITSLAGYALFQNGSNAYLKVNGARLASWYAEAVWMGYSGGTDNLNLLNCLLYTTSAASIDGASGGTSVQCVNVWANHAVGSNISAVRGAVNVDSLLTW